jgi:hypothetical protein
VDTTALRQELAKKLVATIIGGGVSFDVLTPAVTKALAAGVAAAEGLGPGPDVTASGGIGGAGPQSGL